VYVAIVRMDTPVFDHDMVVKVSLSSTDKFAAMKDKGLLMKYYLSRESGGSGGVYIWKSKEDADAWYTPEWSTRLERTYGAKPSVIFYDSFVQVDNTRDQIVVDGEVIEA
jgi:hypothetical protein